MYLQQRAENSNMAYIRYYYYRIVVRSFPRIIASILHPPPPFRGFTLPTETYFLYVLLSIQINQQPMISLHYFLLVCIVFFVHYTTTPLLFAHDTISSGKTNNSIFACLVDVFNSYNQIIYKRFEDKTRSLHLQIISDIFE